MITKRIFMIQLKNKLWRLLLMLPALSFGQTYQWQWGKQAGGITGSADPGFHYVFDESIRDIVVDNNNNTYYLATMREQGQNLNGTSVANYGLNDLFLFSTDCEGNIRWSRPIGGTGDGENAWHIKVDNNGGLYIMATIYNNSYIGDPNAIPVHFDDTHTLPLYTHYDQTIDPAHKAAFLLKYNTSDGTLAWSKSLQGDVNYSSRMCDVQMMYMDASKNIHAVMGFRAGTHLNGLITVPSTYTSTYQYYAVKFNYDNANGNMTPATPVLLPITGDAINAVGREGKVNVVYDESLNRYYIAGKRMDAGASNLIDLSYNNVPFTKAAYVLAFDGTTGAEVWRKELNNGTVSNDDEIHSIIKDPLTSDIYISGRYFNGISVPATFGNYTFPLRNYVEAVPFVVKMNASGSVQWARTPEGMSGLQFGYRFTKGTIAINGNEVAFAKGSWSDIWGSYTMTRPDGDRSDPLLVRLNKDTGAVLGAGEIRSNFNVIDEFTAVAADKDGNYIVGGFFHDQLFTDPNDNVNTMAVNVLGGKSQSFFTKFAKSACSQMSVEETAVQAGIQLYPNPVQDVLTIRSKEPLVSYEIFGTTGQLIKQGTLNMMQEQVVLSSLQTGVYYIKLKTKSSTVTEKILKK
jgi:hypothetical protein